MNIPCAVILIMMLSSSIGADDAVIEHSQLNIKA